ncbi:MAG: DUF6452 family protein [Bacteroidales bacterium]|nr:DUF6452 family protein [Bacteroidales bacterium]
MRLRFRIISLALATLLMPACSEQACYDNTDPLVNISLFESGTGAFQKTDSIRVSGLTDQSPVELLRERSVSSFHLPLNPAIESSVVIIILNGVADTATINYISFLHFVSPECGYTFYSTISGLNTTHNIIDSLIIENKNITVDGERNLRLFY